MLREAARQLVGAGGAAGATVLPLRVEHEVVDDEPGSALEDVDEAHPAVGAVELIVLHDLDHGQVSALGAERVALPGQVLLLCQQLLASG